MRTVGKGGELRVKGLEMPARGEGLNWEGGRSQEDEEEGKKGG